jgi:hypothetical protein
LAAQEALPQPVEPARRAPPSPTPAPRAGVIIDPAAMAPDDPGPGEPPVENRKFPLYASE